MKTQRERECILFDYDLLVEKLYTVASIARRLELQEIANEAEDLCERARAKREKV